MLFRSSCLLASEVIQFDAKPSTASGVSLDTWTSKVERSPCATESRILWLLEPRRTTSVVRWSGTLAHPNRADKPHATMSAFVHFAYEHSLKTIIFADLQSTCSFHSFFMFMYFKLIYACYIGSSGRVMNQLTGVETSGQILFDVMTHTKDGCVLQYI